MPPKDDEEPKTTKEVVSKKHKQMLNREELDLSLIAEAFGGVLVEEPSVVQPSFAGTGKRSTKKKEVPTSEDPREKLKRLLKTSRADKYKTNEPVSGKQAQQFDIDIAGKAADEKSGAGGKPGAGQTKSLRGQTLTKGPYKGATPIGKREASLLRKYAQSPGVGQNPLRAEPGSGAELTAGRKRSLRASARRAIEKQAQTRRSAVGKQIRQAGSKLLTQIQQQAQKGKEVQSRMTSSVEKWAKKEGPKVLKKVQGEVKSKGQLSLPGLGRAFGRGAGARAAAAQDAAIDIAKDLRRTTGFKDLAKAVETRGKPVKGAAADPWKQFPKKPQPQQGLPKTGPSSPLPTTKLLPPAKTQPKPQPTTKPKPQPSAKPQQPKLNVPGGRTVKTAATILGLGRSVIKRDIPGIVTQGLSLGQEVGRLSREMETKRKEKEALKPIKPGTTISVLDKSGKVKQLTPGEFEKLKPKRTPGIKPSEPVTPKKPEPETQPQPEKDKKTGKPKVTTPVLPKTPKAPSGAPAPVKLPDLFRTPISPKPPVPTKTPKRDSGERGKRKRRLPGLGFPQQPGGVIGRRQNPQ